MQKSNQYTLKEAIEALIQTYRLEAGLHQARLKASWAEIAGEFVAKHTTGIRLKSGVLKLSIDSAPVRNELRYGKSKLIQEINKFLDSEAVDDIVLR